MIKAAAIKSSNGKIFSVERPGRHHDVIALMAKLGHKKPLGIQGFITDKGKFVDRIEGLKIAKDNNQIIKKNGNAKMLFSEDLW